jgi:glycosyltransferase involved in cell wall biosynthesis
MSKTKNPLVSIIIPVKNEGSNIKNTIESALKVKTSCPFEIIVVDDGSTDNCCDFIPELGRSQIKLFKSNGVGAAGARNLGAKNASGSFLIFCDAHLFFEDGWIDSLVVPIQKGIADGTTPGIANAAYPISTGFGQTLNEALEVKWQLQKETLSPTAILPGGCIAISKQVFTEIGGFDHGFRVWGFEDIEFSVRMWLFGYRCFVQPSVKILHVFRSSHPYRVDWNDFYFNMMRMAYSHFSEDRIAKCRKLIKNSNPELIESEVLKANVLKQRELYFNRRKFDDSWYMSKFGISF